MRESSKHRKTPRDDGVSGLAVEEPAVDEAVEAQPTVEEVAEESKDAESPSAPSVQGEPVRLSGPFTVNGGNVTDAGGNVVAICGYVHNRANSGPAVAGAVATALNRFYRTPLPEEPVKP